MVNKLSDVVVFNSSTIKYSNTEKLVLISDCESFYLRLEAR